MESITHCHCISHLVASLPLHFTLHHSTSNTVSDIIPNHTTFHVRPSFLTITHISYRTNTSIPLCNTIFQIALYRPHYASHHISHCTQFHITFHITPHSMYTTPHFRSYIGHIMHRTTYLAPHHVSVHNIAALAHDAPHLA